MTAGGGPTRATRRRLLREEHAWMWVRLAGWGLIGAWQALSLAAEFLPLDLGQRGVRLAGKALGLVGTAMLAWGFERIVETAHERTGAHDER